MNAKSVVTNGVGLPALPLVTVSPGTIQTCTFLDDQSVDAIAVGVGAPVFGDDELQPRSGTVHASARYRIDLAELAERAHFKAAAGTTHIVDLPRVHRGSGAVLPWQGLPLRIVIVGVGTGSDADLRKAGAALARVSRGLGKVVTTVTGRSDDRGTAHFVEGYLLSAYQPWSIAGRDPGPAPADELVLLGPNAQEAVDVATRHSQLTWLSRDLAAVPPNLKTPNWLANQFEKIAASADLTVRRWDGGELEQAGFTTIAAVGRGSQNPPVFLEVSYVPAQASEKHVVLVGKGVTFDTGGISIKRPRESMIDMKTDMTGAAVAFSAVLGAAQSKVGHRVTALLPIVENHFGKDSYRPGDILTSYGGTTIEIGNTDAEGRLIMADALEYAVAELEPDLIVDVATLTGAAAMTLGASHGALFTNDSELANSFLAAGAETGERLWHMPLTPDYAVGLESQIADVRNIPQTPLGGGATLAAMFLESFVSKTPWVHLDIAGPSLSAKVSHEINKGPTGFGARVITRFLETW